MIIYGRQNLNIKRQNFWRDGISRRQHIYIPHECYEHVICGCSTPGFTFTEDGVFPGNNGLRDVIKALEWTQTHISSYGGNPNQVTVFGESSGGSLSGLLMVSPLAEGEILWLMDCITIGVYIGHRYLLVAH